MKGFVDHKIQISKSMFMFEIKKILQIMKLLPLLFTELNLSFIFKNGFSKIELKKNLYKVKELRFFTKSHMILFKSIQKIWPEPVTKEIVFLLSMR